MLEQQVQREMWQLCFPLPDLVEKGCPCQYSAFRPAHVPYAAVL